MNKSFVAIYVNPLFEKSLQGEAAKLCAAEPLANSGKSNKKSRSQHGIRRIWWAVSKTAADRVISARTVEQKDLRQADLEIPSLPSYGFMSIIT